ncbi:unnamed protein product [Lactuca saligna]|uniref:Uncharacterized protein n=1 Tax=Lactuca saligna TaxID=75948 RepID=A0AA35VFI5_LACSI|nr:unnamed protein product [Lactuca saligna]
MRLSEMSWASKDHEEPGKTLSCASLCKSSTIMRPSVRLLATHPSSSSSFLLVRCRGTPMCHRLSSVWVVLYVKYLAKNPPLLHGDGCHLVLPPISATSHRTTTTIGNGSCRRCAVAVAIGPPHAAMKWVIVCIPEKEAYFVVCVLFSRKTKEATTTIVRWWLPPQATAGHH